MKKRMFALFTAVSMVLTLGLYAQASPIDDARQQQKQVQSKIDSLANDKNQVKQNLLNNKQVRDQLISDLEQKGYQKEQIETKIKEIEDAIKSLDTAINDAQAEYDSELALFQKRLNAMYVRSRTGADLNELSQSDDFNDLFRRVQAMQSISQADQDMMDSLVQKKQEINDLKAQKEAEEAGAQDQLEQSLAAIQDLEVSRAQAEDRVAATQQDLASLAKQEDQLAEEDKELGALIKKLMSTGKYMGGAMQWPVPGQTHIASYFGYRIHPILRVKKFHSGIDISASKGTYIHAAASGKVIWSGWRSGGGGNTVIIDHGGGIATLYLHIMNGGLLVKEGQIVSAGDVIAKVGSTGLSTGPHLHFTVKKDGEDVDPLKYVSPK